jgi:hypothetical protein
MRRSPSGPCHTAYIPAITASSTCAVHTLLVAFSRRMCCSRVCSAMRSAGFPSASRLTPMMRPGIDRLNSSLVAKNAACGPPYPIGTPKRCELPTGHVRAPLARRREQRERQQVARRHDERAGRVRGVRERPQVGHAAVGGRVLHERAEDVGAERVPVHVAHHHLDAARLGPRAHHGHGLRVAVGGDEERLLARLPLGGVAHRHRLGRRRALVEQRGVGDGQPGEVADHRLEVEQRLEPPLGDLRLVGRVRGVPPRVLEHVALDDRRRERAVIAHAEVRPPHLVAPGDGAQLGEHVVLGARRAEGERAAQPDGLGHRGVDEGVERRVAERAQHRPLLLGARPDVALDERLGLGHGRGERADRSHCDGGDGSGPRAMRCGVWG